MHMYFMGTPVEVYYQGNWEEFDVTSALIGGEECITILDAIGQSFYDEVSEAIRDRNKELKEE